MAALAAYGAATVTFTARTTGDTSDEAGYRDAGRIYLETHHFAENHDHPPLSKWVAALYPKLSGRTDIVAYRYSHVILYVAGGVAIAVVFLSLGMGLAAVIFSGLYFLDPNLKAMASLNVFDADVAVWTALTALACWSCSRQTLTRGRAFGITCLQGFAATTKISALGYLPFTILALRRGRKVALAAIAGFALALFAAYHFRFMELGWFGASIGFQLKHEWTGQPSFFLGKHYAHGTGLYYLVLYFLKEPIAAWAVCVAALGAVVARWRKFAVEIEYFWLPAAVIGFALSIVQVQLGFRYFLPGVVLIQLGTAVVGDRSFREIGGRRSKVAAVCALSAVLAILVIGDFRTVRGDAYLAYFNRLERSPTRDFCDSNNDWLQGLPPQLSARANGVLAPRALSGWEIATSDAGGREWSVLAGASSFCAARFGPEWVLRDFTPVAALAGYELLRLSRKDAWALLWAMDHFDDKKTNSENMGPLAAETRVFSPACRSWVASPSAPAPSAIRRDAVLMILPEGGSAPGFKPDGRVAGIWRAWMDQAPAPAGRNVLYAYAGCR